MKREERTNDPQAALLAALTGWQAGIWTALPGVIDDVDLAKMTARVKPAMQARFSKPGGSADWVNLPLLVDCPVIFPSGGGFTLTFPVTAGDECLVIFASRCIDGWWQSGGQARPLEMRMHDLSDGFVMVGPRSQPHVLGVPASSSSVELRNDSRSAFVQIDSGGNIAVQTAGNLTAQAGGNITAQAAGQATVTAPTIQLTGNVVVTGNLTVNGNTALNGTAVANGKNIGSDHKHGGVQTGTGTSGVPT